MEVPIQEVARLTGITSRTLRHYDAEGLLPPSSVSSGGVRHYDDAAVVRLQRILVMRALGLPLPEIKRVLDTDADPVAALDEHLQQLRSEQARLGRLINAVEQTAAALKEGRPIMAEQALSGFNSYQEEVESRWGKEAFKQSSAWWDSMNDADKAAYRAESQHLQSEWRRLRAEGADPAGPEAQALAARQAAWIVVPDGTPRVRDASGAWRPQPFYLRALADMYEADPRFAANYGGVEGGKYVGDALRAHLAN